MKFSKLLLHISPVGFAVSDCRPHHAVIEAWVKIPTRVLPENQPGTFTNVILQYIQH